MIYQMGVRWAAKDIGPLLPSDWTVFKRRHPLDAPTHKNRRRQLTSKSLFLMMLTLEISMPALNVLG